MLFTDPIYILAFLPACLIVSHFMARYVGTTATLLCIIGFSAIFYGMWGVAYLQILTVSVLFNWIFASTLIRVGDDRNALRFRCIAIGQTFNFFALIWFKYSFYLDFLFGRDGDIDIGIAIIPIGISFYTFQQAVFLQEAYRRDPVVVDYIGTARGLLATGRTFIRYVSFVIFFPQLVIGPIVYLTEFAPQVGRKKFGLIQRKNLEIGVFLIAVGLFKKIVIADTIGTFIDPTFVQVADGIEINVVAAWGASLGYYTQLYFDFSGYSDIALGSARLFGITLPINFDSPLKAVSISDFYRRWHITLTRVISRFLYTPLSIRGMRAADDTHSLRYHALVVWIPLIVNFVAIALWHGAAATFLLFGLIHGLWYILEVEARSTRVWKAWKKKTSKPMRAVIGRALFIIPMMLCFSLFRSDSVNGWLALSGAMVDLRDMAFSKREVLELGIVVISLAVCLFLPNVYELTRDHEPGIAVYRNPPVASVLPGVRWQPDLRWGILIALGLISVFYHIGRQPLFLYLGF